MGQESSELNLFLGYLQQQENSGHVDRARATLTLNCCFFTKPTRSDSEFSLQPKCQKGGGS